ncbi:MAG: EAL domain-containing protein [Acidimicrobiia bacterium]|nr:EAL domain-containing protein [Acidimicrobiia bacterium]
MGGSRSRLGFRPTTTIGVRLGLLLLFPLAGLVLFGLVAASDERQAALAARELGQEAELVELLSSAAVQLDVQADSIAGFQEAGALGVDIGDLGAALGYSALDQFEDYRDLDVVLDEIEAVPTELWADRVAIARLLENRSAMAEIRTAPEVSQPAFEPVRDEMSGAVSDALLAQTARLNSAVGRIELGHDLAAIAQSREASLSLMAAVRDERRALADYLLPFNDEPRDEKYRRLVTATAHYDFVLAELRADLPESYEQSLDGALDVGTESSYDELKLSAVNGDLVPADEVDDPLSLLPYGIVTYVQGFERVRDLLVFDRRLSAEFTSGALALESEAENRLRSAVVGGLVFSLVAVIAGIATVRTITKPVWALLQRARRITEGDLTTTGPRLAPSDIALVHQALDELSGNLRTVTEQAEALSDGRLDDEVLGRHVVGPLGASVHGSVARLRSMTSRLEYEANHDSLTRLPNRAAVMSLLDRCLTGAESDRSPLAIIMLDLDGFKQANDDMGHAIGDEVLIHVAERLRGKAAGEFVARLGGDEFMIVVVGPDGAERAVDIARRCVAAIGEPAAVSSGSIQISASAGIVHTTGPNWLSPSEVLRRVDLAMYEAKLGEHDLVVFDQNLHDSLLETTRLQGEIRRALDRDEFELALQPIVRVADEEIVGYEALIRWESPTRGLVSPGLFIPIAEQSDLIGQIDNWVLGRAAEILETWKTDASRRHLKLSVNISARHLSSCKLVGAVAAELDRYALAADRLLIEVTESQLIPNLARAEDTLRGLRELGVALAIDDFGTGYASVAHLRRIQFDRIKIDRSFLAHLDDETDRSLAALLVSLGRDLELEVVAEGIETPEQLSWARTAGCSHAQGFMLGRPQLVAERDPRHSAASSA